MEKINKQNSDVLPTNSAFGTKFSDSKWMETICIGSDEKRCGEKLKYLEVRLKSAPAYKTLACIIQKNMSTIIEAIMCFLSNEKQFRDVYDFHPQERDNSSLVFDRLEVQSFCPEKSDDTSSARAEELFNLTHQEINDWLYLTVVRDPVDRFLSGYVDKCIRQPRTPKGYCNGCEKNMTCFIITEYERIMENSYSEFISSTFEDLHFFPQSWRCNFINEMEHYKFIPYHSAPQHEMKFVDDLLHVLRIQKIPEESIQFIKNQVTGGRTYHSTISSNARVFFEERLRSSPFLLEYVIRMFYWDFKLFGFELPRV